MTKNAIKEKQGLVNIANEEWPALSEISAGRFKINKKSQVTDIDTLAKNLQAVSEQDDKIIQSSLEEDEKLLNRVSVTKANKPTRGRKNVKVAESMPSQQTPVKTPLEKVQEPVQPVIAVENNEEVEEIVTTPKMGSTLGRTIATSIGNTTGKIISQVKEPVKQEVREAKHEFIDEATPVATQTQVRYASSATENKVSPNVLMKFIAMGFAHLYVKKTTSVLKPLSFVADNFTKVFMALLHLGIPLVMTWFLMTKVEFIATQMAKEHQIMHFGYSIIFYIACLFVWVSAQVVGSGLVTMFRKTLVDVAKVGKENR